MSDVLSLSRDNILKLIKELQSFFKGIAEEIEVYVASQIAGLPTLLIGGHGTGKTTLVKAFYDSLMVEEGGSLRPVKRFMILLKERHTPFDVFYTYHLPSLMRGVEKVVPKAIDAEAVYLDEVFANPLVLSALKDFLEERVYDKFEVKWLFFTASTNPPNQYYQTVLQLTNMADLDRFDVVIPIESRLGVDLYEIAGMFAESEERRPEPSISKIDVTNINRVRGEIFKIPVSVKAKSMMSLFGHVFNACCFEDEDRQKHFIDKFSVLADAPCIRCTFKGSLCSKFAVQPMRLIRSTFNLAKTLAWLYGKDEVTYDLTVKALHYTLPLRLIIIDEAYKSKVATLKEATRIAIREFTKWYDENRPLFTVLKNCVLLARKGRFSEAFNQLNDLAYRYNNRPIALTLIHSFEAKLRRAKEEVKRRVETTDDVNLLKELVNSDNDFRDLAKKRYAELLGLVSIKKLGDEAKRVLNRMLARGLLGEKEFTSLSMSLQGFYSPQDIALREDLKISVKQNEVVIEGSKEVISSIIS